MKIWRKRWLLALIVLVCIAASYLVHATNRPVRIQFSEMRSESGMLVATFAIENRTDRVVYFQNTVTFHDGRKDHNYTRSGLWPTRDKSSGLPKLSPNERAELKVALRSEAPKDSDPVAPFHLEVTAFNVRSVVWERAPLSWLPSRLKPPARTRIWSELVTP